MAVVERHRWRAAGCGKTGGLYGCGEQMRRLATRVGGDATLPALPTRYRAERRNTAYCALLAASCSSHRSHLLALITLISRRRRGSEGILSVIILPAAAACIGVCGGSGHDV